MSPLRSSIIILLIMAVQPAFLQIADIGGYTRFMNMHRTSLAHAQDIISGLLEAVIDATRGRLTLSKLEGDAAFFYIPYSPGAEPDLSFVADQVARIYRAFHNRIEDFKASNWCKCDGCTQAGNLKLKFTSHLGEAAIQKIKRWTELAGVDVILVHRMLKNDVPVPEYLLMTDPLLRHMDDEVRQRASALPMDLAELGTIDAHFVDLARYVGEIPPKPRHSLPARFFMTLPLALRTLPYVLGLRKPRHAISLK